MVEQLRATMGRVDDSKELRINEFALNRISMLLASGELPQLDSLRRAVEELQALSGRAPELQALIAKFNGDLPKLIERRREQSIAQAEGILKETATACLAANVEADLDPLARQLGEATNSLPGDGRGDERVERIRRRLQAAAQAVSTWQDYLAFWALGDETGGAHVLKRLIENRELPIIPKAEIDKRLKASEGKAPVSVDVGAMLREVRKIEDLTSILEKARATYSGEKMSSQRAQLVQFERLAAALVSLDAGFIGEAFQVASSPIPGGGAVLPADWTPELTRLRGLLLMKVLPRYMELPDCPPMKEQEAASDYLLRLAGDLVAQRRFAETIRVLETYRSIAFAGVGQPPSWIQADIDGLRSYAAADRLAAVGSWPEAINSLRRVSETAGKFTPAAEAGQRLVELSAAHPEDAKTAARLAESEAFYQRLSRDINEAARAMENRLPPDVRSRMPR
jgi:hypothetical protein